LRDPKGAETLGGKKKGRKGKPKQRDQFPCPVWSLAAQTGFLLTPEPTQKLPKKAGEAEKRLGTAAGKGEVWENPGPERKHRSFV